jgi:hypothetical protein
MGLATLLPVLTLALAEKSICLPSLVIPLDLLSFSDPYVRIVILWLLYLLLGAHL